MELYHQKICNLQFKNPDLRITDSDSKVPMWLWQKCCSILNSDEGFHKILNFKKSTNKTQEFNRSFLLKLRNATHLNHAVLHGFQLSLVLARAFYIVGMASWQRERVIHHTISADMVTSHASLTLPSKKDSTERGKEKTKTIPKQAVSAQQSIDEWPASYLLRRSHSYLFTTKTTATPLSHSNCAVHSLLPLGV